MSSGSAWGRLLIFMVNFSFVTKKGVLRGSDKLDCAQVFEWADFHNPNSNAADLQLHVFARTQEVRRQNKLDGRVYNFQGKDREPVYY